MTVTWFNPVYDKYEVIELDDVSTSAWRTFTTKFTFNSDENPEILVYIYPNSSYTNSSGQVVFLERLLERDSEYTINGSEITTQLSRCSQRNRKH